MELVLTSSIPVLFSSEKILSVRFSVLKKWEENRTELNFGNTSLQLSDDFCGSIITKPPEIDPVEFWVDASSSWGIGIIFGNDWDFWKFRPGWDKNGRNIGWAEFVAIELGLLFAIDRGYSDVHFRIKSDNQGVIHAIEGGKSRSPEQNTVLQRITLLLSSHKLWISSFYVPSSENLADLPSRGLPAPNRFRASHSFILPFCLQPFLIYPV